MAAGGRGPHAEERAVSEATPGRRRDEHLRDVDPIVIRWTSPMRPMELWWFGPGPRGSAAPTGARGSRTYRWVTMPPQARGALLGTHPLQRRRRPAREEEREAGLGSDGRAGLRKGGVGGGSERID